jgi:hypothetical protein
MVHGLLSALRDAPGGILQSYTENRVFTNLFCHFSTKYKACSRFYIMKKNKNDLF